jgi:hypothetical protein
MASALPRLAAPRTAEALETVRALTGGRFDVDAWHVIDERDNSLIQDEILNGAQSAAFVYSFEISGQRVSGISVVGARHLAAHYQGLKHRLVASTQKVGALFTFYSFPSEGMPMSVSCNIVPELAAEPDYYSVVVDLTDVKTGNTIQIETREQRFEHRRDGSAYERPHYQKIAQSKAFRNGALHLIPQDVQQQFLSLMLKQGKGVNITPSVIGEMRSNVMRFAASHAVPLNRLAVEHLSSDQISGLRDAAREGVPAFVNAARGLGLDFDREPSAGEPAAAPRRRGRPPRPSRLESGSPPQPEPEPEQTEPGEHEPDGQLQV